jgi:hypothetical protein
MTRNELQSLLSSDQRDCRRRGVEHLVALLSSHDRASRLRGYATWREQLEEALYQSCLNYRSLVRGLTHPLETVMEETIECWATAHEVSARARPALCDEHRASAEKAITPP